MVLRVRLVKLAKSRDKYQCDDCYKQFSTAQSLSRHQQGNYHSSIIDRETYNAIAAEWYECIVCRQLFRHVGCYDSHCSSCHARPRKQKCSMCHLFFRTAANKNYHLAAAHGIGEVKLHKCTLCKIAFPVISDLHAHNRSSHPAITVMLYRGGTYEEVAVPALRDQRPFCQFCGKTFRTVAELQSHTRQQHILRTILTAKNSS